MATYYVDFVNGADANNGLGPDASAVSNKPWKTITKLLGAAGMASGDTAYLSPAGPFRETVSVAMTSAVAETKIIGDPANVQGFKTSGGVLVAPGPVTVTAYTTNDKTAPSGTTLVDLTGRDFLTFQNIMFVGGSALIVTANTQTSTNIKFTDCCFLGGFKANTGLIGVTSAFATALTWTLDRCLFLCGGATGYSGFGINVTCVAGVGADYDINFVVQNSLFLCSGGPILVQNSGASANKGNGVKVRNCFFYPNGSISCGSGTSTTLPSTINNSFIYAGSNNFAISATTSGQVTEDYNLIVANSPRTNVTAGTHSISDGAYAPLFHFGQERIWGMLLRKLGEPMAGSPLLGFGNDGNQTSYDFGNNPRPAGGTSASPGIGALERANTWGQETGTVRTGSNALSITGPGYQDFDLPVDASSVVVSCYMRFDSTYAGTKPQIQVLNGSECGVADATSSVVTTVNTWEQLSLTIVPTAKGIVTVRLLSSDTNGAGKAFADDFSLV